TDTAAIHILSGLLSDGASTATAHQHPHHLPKQSLKQKPALIPPPSQIALLATLIIHPSFTSRPSEKSNLHAASYALSYLRGLLSTVGAVNANFRTAFEFGDAKSGTIAHRRYHRHNSNAATNTNTTSTYPSSNDDDDNDDDESDAALTGPFARSQLLFRRAPDFWAVLGWCFRCAAEHPHARWPHWRLWLNLAVAVLEADLDERLERDSETGTSRGSLGCDKSASPYPALEGSLVVGYLGQLARERRNGLREVLRALFAFSDGEVNGASDRALFREVFERETAVGRGAQSKRKREEGAVVDLENDQFGDYLDVEAEFDFFEDGEEQEEEGEGGGGGKMPTPPAAPSGRKRSGRKPKGEKPPSFVLTDAIAETVSFRLRIFRLLSAVCYYLPTAFVSVGKLYETFTNHVRALPLPMFRLFVESHPSHLPEFVQVSLLRMVAEELLPPRRPDPADVDPDNATAAGSNGVTALVMRECFLPFAADRVTAEDNAKLSIVLESLLWFVYVQIGIDYSPELRRAVEKGIKAREDRINKSVRGKTNPGLADREARESLARSSRNLRTLVDVIAISAR
ncbi:hypothetical protein P885DRAFT_25973, partial [Corynascus similis CBS 632.67]